MTRRYTAPYVSDITVDPFIIVCLRCDRRRRYSKAWAIAMYGDMPAPSFLRAVTSACPHTDRIHDPCRLKYEHLMARPLATH